jgi:hypothetical protein
MRHFRTICFFIAVGLTACGDNQKNANTEKVSDSLENSVDSSLFKESNSADSAKKYSNERFKDVTVKQVGADQFVVEGKAQVFEANFGWVVEDGHNELKQGFQTADAGAPGWGNFKFEIEVDKQRPNSTLMLILFESSAKDGSRQHELPILLEE